MNAVLKPASLADTEVLLPLMAEYYAFDQLDWNEAVARTALRGLLADERAGRVWLIYAGAQLVGYVALTLGYSLEYGGRDAFVDEVFLRQASRRQGLGTQALAVVFDACRQLEVRAVHLEVARANSAAYALYEKLGFVNHQQRMMTKRLDEPRA